MHETPKAYNDVLLITRKRSPFADTYLQYYYTPLFISLKKIYILVSYNFLYRTKPYFPFFLLILQLEY